MLISTASLNLWQVSKFILAVIFVFFAVSFSTTPTYALTPNDPHFQYQWYLERIGAGKAWDVTTGSSLIKIAILDTGIESSHEDLQSNMWVNSGEIAGNGIDDDQNNKVDDYNGWDFVNNDNDPSDDNGHGTHVAGVAAATTNNSTGVASLGYNTKLMNIKIGDQNNNTTWQRMADGIHYAVDQGANIINISFASTLVVGSNDYNTIYAAVEYAQQHNVLITSGVGNNGTDITSTNRDYPAYFSEIFNNVISVAGSNKADQKYSSSNYANWITMAAPAEEIKTTKPANIQNYSCITPDGNYCTVHLNSYTGPQVAGIAALLLTQNPSWTPSQVRDQIALTADNISGTGSNWHYGRINACKAVGGTNCDVTNGLVGYWKMNESSWLTDCLTPVVTESSGNNLTGKNCPILRAPNTTTGYYSRAGEFDGVNDYVDMGLRASLNNQNFTYGAWIKRDSTAGNQGVFAISSTGGASGGPVFYLNTAGKLTLARSGTSACTGNSALTDTTNWHHVAVTFDGAYCRFYIDGNLDATVTKPWTQSFYFGANRAYIGAQTSSATLFDGLVDEMRVYNRPLSDSEVAQTLNPATATTSGLAGYWTMDEANWVGNCYSATVYDTSGNSNHGNACPSGGGASAAAGKFANAAVFDGIDDYFDIGSQSVLNNQTFTYSAWIKRSWLYTNQAIFAISSISGSSGGPVFYFGTNNKLTLAKAGSALCSGNSTITDMVWWHHVVVTYDGSNCRFYIDGNLDASPAFSQTFSFGSNKAFIGAHTTTATFFRGLIDDSRVYNRALSASEITALFNAVP